MQVAYLAPMTLLALNYKTGSKRYLGIIIAFHVLLHIRLRTDTKFGKIGYHADWYVITPVIRIPVPIRDLIRIQTLNRGTSDVDIDWDLIYGILLIFTVLTEAQHNLSD